MRWPILCAAHYDASATSVVRKALDEFIAARCDTELGGTQASGSGAGQADGAVRKERDASEVGQVAALSFALSS